MLAAAARQPSTWSLPRRQDQGKSWPNLTF